MGVFFCLKKQQNRLNLVDCWRWLSANHPHYRRTAKNNAPDIIKSGLVSPISNYHRTSSTPNNVRLLQRQLRAGLLKTASPLAWLRGN